MKNKTIAIILAGGFGSRMETQEPKQFLEINNVPIIVRTLLAFEESSLIDGMIIVSHCDYVERIDELIKNNNISKIMSITTGGKTRQESSFNGLKECPQDAEYVMIHDAARPFIDNRIIEDLLKATEEVGAATPAIEVEDTIITDKDSFIEGIVDRKRLKRVQTPQCFRYKTIVEAHDAAIEKGIIDATDDCSLVLGIGKKVKLTEGSLLNIKITKPADLTQCESIIKTKAIS